MNLLICRVQTSNFSLRFTGWGNLKMMGHLNRGHNPQSNSMPTQSRWGKIQVWRKEVDPALCEEISFDSGEKVEDVGTIHIAYRKATKSQNMKNGNKFTRYGNVFWVVHFVHWIWQVLTVCDPCIFGLKNKFQLACQILDLLIYVDDAYLWALCKVREMASTWTMNVFNMWMQYTQPHEVSSRCWIVEPLWVQLAIQSNVVDDILRHV